MTADHMASEKTRRSRSAATAVALTIAGSDSSAGAGIQADLKTFSALGIYGLNAITCIVAETPGKVSRIDPVDVEGVGAQIRVLLANFPVRAIKTGMLYSAEIVSRTAREIADARRNIDSLWLVVDPVMIATSGDALVRDDAVKAYETELFPLANLITPNLDEAEKLSGMSLKSAGDMRKAGEMLARKYGVAFLLKGGHLRGPKAVDLLFLDGNVMEFADDFIADVSTHGTGCTYSAAIAAGLASGLSMKDAVGRAKHFVTAAIRDHHAWGDIHALNHSTDL